VRPLTAFFLFLIILPSKAAFGEALKELEALKQNLTTEYVKEFADEYNSFSYQDVKDTYQFLMPKAERSSFFKLYKHKPQVQYKKNVIYFVGEHGEAAKIEILDILEQKYKINGNAFAYDWNGSLLLQSKTIGSRLRDKQAAYEFFPILDLFIPQAQAQPTLIYDILELAIQLCKLDCEELGIAVASFAQRSSIAVAENSELLFQISRSLERKSALTVLRALKRAEPAASAVVSRAESAGPALISGSEKWLARIKEHWLSTFLPLTLTGLGFWYQSSTNAQNNARVDREKVQNALVDEAIKHGYTRADALKCILENKTPDPDHCPPERKFNIDVNISDWCPKPSANEFDRYQKTGEGNVALIVRVDSSGYPVSAVRFVYTDSEVQKSSIRYYTISKYAVVEGHKPDSIDNTVFPTNKLVALHMGDEKEKNSFNANIIDDMHQKIISRDNFLTEHAPDSPISRHLHPTYDHVNSNNGGEGEGTDASFKEEVLWANSINRLMADAAASDCGKKPSAGAPTAPGAPPPQGTAQ
jgi:hypothetical protein